MSNGNNPFNNDFAIDMTMTDNDNQTSQQSRRRVFERPQLLGRNNNQLQNNNNNVLFQSSISRRANSGSALSNQSRRSSSHRVSTGTHSSNAAQPEPYRAQENAQQSVSRSTKAALSDLSNQSRRSSSHRVSTGTHSSNAAQPEPDRALACQENAQQSSITKSAQLFEIMIASNQYLEYKSQQEQMDAVPTQEYNRVLKEVALLQQQVTVLQNQTKNTIPKQELDKAIRQVVQLQVQLQNQVVTHQQSQRNVSHSIAEINRLNEQNKSDQAELAAIREENIRLKNQHETLLQQHEADLEQVILDNHWENEIYQQEYEVKVQKEEMELREKELTQEWVELEHAKEELAQQMAGVEQDRQGNERQIEQSMLYNDYILEQQQQQLDDEREALDAERVEQQQQLNDEREAREEERVDSAMAIPNQAQGAELAAALLQVNECDNKLLSMNERLQRIVRENKSFRLRVNEQQESRMQFKAISINPSEATIVEHLGRDKFESLKKNFGMPFDREAFVKENNQVYARPVLDSAITKMAADPLTKLNRSLNSFVRSADERAVKFGKFQRPTYDLFVDIGYSRNSDEAPIATNTLTEFFLTMESSALFEQLKRKFYPGIHHDIYNMEGLIDVDHWLNKCSLSLFALAKEFSDSPIGQYLAYMFLSCHHSMLRLELTPLNQLVKGAELLSDFVFTGLQTLIEFCKVNRDYSGRENITPPLVSGWAQNDTNAVTLHGNGTEYLYRQLRCLSNLLETNKTKYSLIAHSEYKRMKSKDPEAKLLVQEALQANSSSSISQKQLPLETSDPGQRSDSRDTRSGSSRSNNGEGATGDSSSNQQRIRKASESNSSFDEPIRKRQYLEPPAVIPKLSDIKSKLLLIPVNYFDDPILPHVNPSKSKMHKWKVRLGSKLMPPGVFLETELGSLRHWPAATSENVNKSSTSIVFGGGRGSGEAKKRNFPFQYMASLVEAATPSWKKYVHKDCIDYEQLKIMKKANKDIDDTLGSRILLSIAVYAMHSVPKDPNEICELGKDFQKDKYHFSPMIRMMKNDADEEYYERLFDNQILVAIKERLTTSSKKALLSELAKLKDVMSSDEEEDNVSP